MPDEIEPRNDDVALKILHTADWHLGRRFASFSEEDAKKLVKTIKDSGLKVQAQIMEDMVRVTGKKIDDLQEVIALCRTAETGIPLQFENMRS